MTELKLCSGRMTATIRVPDQAARTFTRSVDAATDLAAALQHPTGLPQLHECIVPGDRVVIAVDPETPRLIEVLTEIWAQFQSADADLDVTVLFPPDSSGNRWQTLIEELPVHFRNQAAVQVYNREDETQRRYLASSSDGRRIYLSHYLVDADLIVTVGIIGFDATMGVRGTNSILYPGFADQDAVEHARRAVCTEFAPEDTHAVRELADEVGWLLGTQFAVQLVPVPDGGMAEVFCGGPPDVMSAAQRRCTELWRLTVSEQSELAVISIPGETVCSWQQLGLALESALRLVGDGGRIAVVADLPEQMSPQLEMLRRSSDPEGLLSHLKRELPEHALETMALIEAVLRTKVYLFCGLEPSVVEDLGMIPLSNEAELQRLIDTAESVNVLPLANYAWVDVSVPSGF